MGQLTVGQTYMSPSILFILTIFLLGNFYLTVRDSKHFTKSEGYKGFHLHNLKKGRENKKKQFKKPLLGNNILFKL